MAKSGYLTTAYIERDLHAFLDNLMDAEWKEYKKCMYFGMRRREYPRRTDGHISAVPGTRGPPL